MLSGVKGLRRMMGIWKGCCGERGRKGTWDIETDYPADLRGQLRFGTKFLMKGTFWLSLAALCNINLKIKKAHSKTDEKVADLGKDPEKNQYFGCLK